MVVDLEKLNVNKFWEKTPTPLKYILVFVIFLTVSYFLISKNVEEASIKELNSMKSGIKATYELIDNFEKFRSEQTSYNQEILTYIHNLHSLVEELNDNTNKKIDIILNAGQSNKKDMLEKIMLLNQSFEKLSKAYQVNIKEELPNSRNAHPYRDTLKF